MGCSVNYRPDNGGGWSPTSSLVEGGVTKPNNLQSKVRAGQLEVHLFDCKTKVTLLTNWTPTGQQTTLKDHSTLNTSGKSSTNISKCVRWDRSMLRANWEHDDSCWGEHPCQAFQLPGMIPHNNRQTSFMWQFLAACCVFAYQNAYCHACCHLSSDQSELCASDPLPSLWWTNNSFPFCGHNQVASNQPRFRYGAAGKQKSSLTWSRSGVLWSTLESCAMIDTLCTTTVMEYLYRATRSQDPTSARRCSVEGERFLAAKKHKCLPPPVQLHNLFIDFFTAVCTAL